MRRRCLLSPLLVAGLVGCGGGNPSASKPPEVAPVIAPPTTGAIEPAVPVSADPPPQPNPADPPVKLPDDLGGQAVAGALAVAPPPADVPKTDKPAPRTSPLDRGDLPLPGVTPRPFAPAVPAGKPANPTPPRDRAALAPLPYPDGLPLGTAESRPLLKAAGPSNPGAADVPGVSPQRVDRASLEDPTTDLSAGRVIATPLPVPTAGLPFLSLRIPDPFELVEQLKGKLGREPEFGSIPK